MKTTSANGIFGFLLAATLCLTPLSAASATQQADRPFALEGQSAPAQVQAGETVPSAHAIGAASTTTPVLGIETAKNAKPKKPSKAQLRAFKKASASFSIKLLQRSVAAKGKNANVAIAPMSVMNALAMCANGAADETRKEMRQLLGQGASMARINKNLRWYNSQLANTRKARIANANAIWYHDGDTLTMRKKFLSKIRTFYGAAATPADFGAASTVRDINAWVAENTNGMIKRIVSKLEADCRIALVNAQYFDAKWKTPFEPTSVSTKTFTNAKGQKRKVKMMRGMEHSYIAGENVKGFVKPYARGYSYVALLPNKGVSLKKFVASLDGGTFSKLVSGAVRANVSIQMPKHSLTYSNPNMRSQLVAMGARLPFDPDKADFSNMGTDTQGNLFIDRVVHKTRIDVDEAGTKAAAATAVVMVKSTAFLDKVKTVNLNRPFVYAIVDNATKLPLFIGTVNDIRS